MKHKAWITAAVCAVVLAAVSVISGFWSQLEDEKVVSVGFIFSEDESTPYTFNFAQTQYRLEETFGSQVKIFTMSNVPGRDSEEPIRELVRKGCQIIFINLDTDTPLSLAREFPAVQFCQVSLPTISLEGAPANYHTFNGEIYEARYASGVAAGLKLRSLLDQGELSPAQAIVGYVGANGSSEVVSGMTAFLLGVRSVAPEAVMRVRYTGSWSNYNREKVCTRQLIEEGCVIIAQHVNTIAPAVACEQAAAEGWRVYHVGYHQSMLDVAPTTSLISIRTNWVPYVTGAVQAVLQHQVIEKAVGGHVHGNDVSAGFAQDWVQLLELNDFAAAPGTQEKLNQVVKDFCRGRIDVFRGPYTGVNAANPKDTVDLNQGYTEHKNSSQPSFCYILKDVITVEN